MRSMLKKYVRGCLALALAVCLFGPCPAEASTTLQFSDFSSDETPPGDLTAIVTFTVDDSKLIIEINNTSAYHIAQLYFNTDESLTDLDFSTSPNPDWTISGSGASQEERADGFGLFNWLIDFGSGDSRLDAEITTLALNMPGNTSESIIGNKFSVIPPGDRPAIAAMKFEAGPNGDSAFGATNTVVPLPSTCLLLASGLLGLVAVRSEDFKKD